MGQARDEAGNIWETDAQGNPVRLLQAAGAPKGNIFNLPPDPSQQARDRRAEEASNRAQQAQDRAAQAQAEAQQLARDKYIADLYKQGLQPGPDGTPVPIPGWQPLPAAQSPKQAAADRDRLSRLNQLMKQIDRVQALFEAGPGSTSGARGLGDYLPSDANVAFDTAAAALSQMGLAAFRVPGTGTVSDRDAIMFDRANLPTASTRDVGNEEILNGLRMRVEEEMSALAQPAPEWTIGGAKQARRDDGSLGPVAQQNGGQGSSPGAPPMTPLNTLRIGNNAGPTAAPFGATEGSPSAPPPELTAEIDALVGRMIQQNGGRLDPEAYAREAAPIMRKYNYEPGDLVGWANDINGYLDSGGKTIPSGVQVEDRPLSTIEMLRNSAVNNPVGGALAGFADAGGFGGVSYLLPEQMQALGDSQPVGMTLGQVGGSITGTNALGRVGAGMVRRALPAQRAAQLLGGGAAGQFGRNVAADAAYSGVYGTATGQDPLESVALGTLGSVGGQGVAKAVGRGVSGVTSSPTLARLREMGISPTIGQIARGRAADNGGRSIVAGIEDTLANSGPFGYLTNTARTRALEEANQAAFNVASPGGRPITAAGEQGLDQLDTAVEAAYDAALGNVNLDAADPQFVNDFNAAGARGQAVDAARNRGDFGYVLNNELAPLYNGPTIDGGQLQDTLRLLRGQSRAYNKAAGGLVPDPSAAGVANAFGDVQTAFTDLAGRTDPATIPALNEANTGYRNLMVLDDAAMRGRNEEGLFTGAQLGDAIKANNSSLGQRGLRSMSDSPFYQLQQDMQRALPNKIPPTGVNAAPTLALAGAAAAGTGEATDNDWLRYGGLAGLAALPYTRAGQRAAAAALLDRPVVAQQLGRQIRNRAGIFGSASLPLLIME